MANNLDKTLSVGRKLVPGRIFQLFQKPYHYVLAFLANFYYANPSRELKVIAITGTKGKTTTVEILNAILEEAGYKTAISSSLRSKVGDETVPNLYKMTTPGRFFIQRLLRQATLAKCDYAILEMTSQAVLNYRHKFIEFDGLIFTGIHPEHIEAHGSFLRYLAAKLEIAKAVLESPKQTRTIVANLDDQYGALFLNHKVENLVEYRLADWKAHKYKTALPGDFNCLNILAAAGLARAEGIEEDVITRGIAKVTNVPGRMESIDKAKKFGFKVIVDYAHTGGSLEEVYKLFKDKYTICVLGSCGGGRDKWVRPVKGKLAENYCSEVILTDEDPYDEDPKVIVEEIMSGMTKQRKVTVEMDRRKAIAKALSRAKKDSVVLITGKGTDPYIMGPKGSKLEWSDKQVAEEELAKLGK